MEPTESSQGPQGLEQVMSAQPAPLRMVNGVGSSAPEPRGERAHGDEGQSAGGDARTRTADEVATGTEPGSVEERGVAPQQSRDVTLTPPDILEGTTTRQRARQDAFLEIADVGSARAAGIEPRSVENASSYQGFMTPRSSATGAPGTTWLAGMEVPRWMTRLGSYLSIGSQNDPLIPSPLVGTGSYGSPPGGPTFTLRSPGRRERVQRPVTPSTSSIPAEAIQMEVQRQLGGILGRLQAAETENERLREDLSRERMRSLTIQPTMPPALPVGNVTPQANPNQPHPQPTVDNLQAGMAEQADRAVLLEPSPTPTTPLQSAAAASVPIFGGPGLPEP